MTLRNSGRGKCPETTRLPRSPQLSSRQIIKKVAAKSASPDQAVRSGEELARVFVPENSAVPIVECFKAGDVIQHIDIRCSCGQTTRLMCEYRS